MVAGILIRRMYVHYESDKLYCGGRILKGFIVKGQRKILGEFVGHLATGAAMFVALMLFGGALNLLVHWADPIVGDEMFSYLMKWVERVILYADVAFIVWWVVYSTYKAIKELENE